MNRILIIFVIVLFLLGSFLYFAVARQSPLETSKPKNGPATQEIIAQNLEIPWELAILPSGDILFTERPGRIRIVKDGKLRETPVLTINEVAHVGEGGLLGLALHPNFSSNNYIYVYYTYRSSDGLMNKVVRHKLEDSTLKEDKIIIDNIPGGSNHDGGRVKFGPDNKLYITTGDAGQTSLSQDKNSLAGKILRLNDDGSIPNDNPFGSPVYSYGHRNPEGLAWDSNGQLWATEHGSQAFDEVNRIESGKNYGWPEIRGDQEKEGMEKPIIHSGNSTWAPSGMTIVDNQIYFTGLRGAAIFKLNPDTKELMRYFEGEFGRLRTISFIENTFFVLTSNRDGRGIPKQNDDRIVKVGLIN